MERLRDLRLHQALEQLPAAPAGAGVGKDAGASATQHGARQAQQQRAVDVAGEMGRAGASLRAVAQAMLRGGEPHQSARRLRALGRFLRLIDDLHVSGPFQPCMYRAPLYCAWLLRL